MATEDDFSSLPLPERIVHKQWKVRVAAYECLTDIYKNAKENSPDFSNYLNMLKNIAKDPNLPAQEAGLVTFQAFLENAPVDLSIKTRNLIVPIIAEKHLPSTRTGIRIKALEVILLYMEIDVPDPVIELIIPLINHKTPKVVAAAISAIKEGLQCYGSKNVNIKPLLKSFPKIFGHSDKKVRDEAFALAVEIYEWIGQSIENFLEPLKPVQVKELHDLFSKAQSAGSKTQKRLLRSQKLVEQQEMDIDDGDENAMEEDNVEDEPLDTYNLIDPVNVLDKIPKGFYDRIKSTKWKERKEVLEELLTVLSPPKYEEGRYGELLTALAKHIGDPNILCVIISANCIEKIAQGIKNSFSSYRSIVIGPLLDRLKEKKQNVIDALSNALDALYLSSTIADITEIVIEKMKNKNPLLKSETIKWLIRCLKTGKGGPQREQIKLISEALLKDISDSNNTVREAAAECFATMMKCVGEKPMAQYVEQVDKSREAKIKEYYEKVEIKSLKTTKNVPKQKKQMPSSNSMDIRNKENSPPSDGKFGKHMSMNINQKSNLRKKTALPGGMKQQKTNDMMVDKEMNTTNDSLCMTEEQAVEQAKILFGEEIISNLKATVWKARLLAMENLLNELKQNNSNEINAELITKLLSVKPGWKESNFQVNTRLYSVLKYVSTLTSFNEQVASLSIPHITEKLGDLKIKKVAGECLESYIESIGFQTVLKYMYDTLKNTNNPKMIADSFLWINSNLLDFGNEGIDVVQLIEILKIGFNHSSPACRNNAVSVITTLRMYCGPDIRNFIEDINPTLLSNIDNEFEKVSTRTPPKPSRIQGTKNNIIAEKTSPKIPEKVRVDISQQLTGKLIDNLGSSNWRLRKEAIETITSIINEAGQSIKPNLGDLPQTLIPRFNDTNKNLIVKAIDLYSLLAISTGPPFVEYAKVLLNSLLPSLGDNKPQIRISANNALNSTLTIMPFDTLLSILSEVMTVDQPLFRKEISKWLNEKLSEVANNNKKMPDLNLILNPIILYLMDKNNEVRHEAQGCFTYIANTLSVDTIKKAYAHIKGAENFVVPLLESIHPGSVVIKSPPKQSTTVKEIPGLSKARLAGSNKRRSQAPQTMGMSAKREAQMEISAQPPIITLDNRSKEIRAEKDKGLLKWSFDNPKQELNDILSEQSENHFSSEIHKLLFSASHYKEKDHLQALNQLCMCISDRQYTLQKYGMSWEENCLRIISVTDLILKYLTLRFCDTNTTILIKCLDLLDSLFALLDENGYYLSEYEASCFLPSFINKVGDNKDIIRQRIRILMKQLCRIYPASRSFSYISEGLKSKNSRTRTECLEELGCLIQRNGLTVCHQNKAFAVIANQISDRDASVRNAAINTIIEAYKQIGNNIFKYLGRISERDRGLIDEKLKRLPPSSTFQKKSMSNDIINQNSQVNSMIPNKKNISEMNPQSPTPMEIDEPSASNNSLMIGKPFEQTNVKKEFSLDIDKLNLPQLSNPINYDINLNNDKTINSMKNIESSISMNQINNINNIGSMSNNDIMNNYRNSMTVNGSINGNSYSFNSNRRSIIDFSTSGVQKDYMMDFITTQIMSGVSSESVDALKQLDPILRNHSEIIIPHINQTINAITFQMKLVFSSENINSPSLVRLCKHLINVLVLIFSNIELSRSISKDSLYPLFEEVLKGMLDHNLTKSEAGSQLVRALNILMVRILDNSNRNISFSALLLLLEKSSAILVSMSENDNEKITVRAKFTELVMKCLWKMTKALQKMLETNTLQVNQLLLDINNLFIATPPSEWKRRATKNFPIGDMPLRTVKTILSELTSSLGDKIFEHFDLINDPQRSYVYSYISHMVQSQKKRNAMNSNQNYSNSNYSNSSSTSSSPTNIQQKFVSYQQNQQVQQKINEEKEANGNQANSLNTSNNGDEIDLKLDNLFSKMQRGDQIKPTIKEIYQILQTYPESKSKIEERIENSSSLIRTLVRRGLSTLSESSTTSIPTYSYQNETNQRLSMMSSKSTDDTTETYKQKLLRLQQMFGYKNENISNNNSSSSLNSQKYSSSTLSPSTSSQVNMSIPQSNNSSLPLRHSIGQYKYNSSNSANSVTVAGLKERLERMKQSMNNQHI